MSREFSNETILTNKFSDKDDEKKTLDKVLWKLIAMYCS